ncbi:MAG: alpha/beta fold hydrolase [Myxococcota bacterium]
MLFLHGFTGAPSSGSALAAALNVTFDAPWLVGHGPTPPTAKHFEDEVARIAGSLDEGPRGVVAYSMGARLGLRLAQRFPTRVRYLVLIGVNPGLESEQARAERRADDEARARHLEAHGVEAFVAAWEAMPLFGEASLPASVRQERRRVRRAHTARGLAASLRCVGLGAMSPMWPYLSDMKLPIRLLYGERDTKFAALAARAAQLAPSAEAVAIANADHDALLAAPRSVAAVIEGLEGLR